MTAVRGAAARIAGVAACLALLASCARQPRVAPVVSDLATLHRAGCAAREEIAQAVQEDFVLRVDGRATGKLPALSADLSLASPDRLRVRAVLLFGTAFDLLVSGDSASAWVPIEDLAIKLGGAGDSVGLGGTPVRLLARTVGATWLPPREAWDAASPDSLGWWIAWREGADSLRLSVAADGRPRQLRVERDTVAVLVRWDDWTTVRGRAWPSRLELRDAGGWGRVRIEVLSVHAPKHAEESWFAWRTRSDATVVGWDELRERIARRRRSP